VMLSAETAAGDYPVDAVSIMGRIIARTERDEAYRAIMDTTHPDPESTAPDAITAAARQVAETIGAAAIVTYTTSGSTTLRAARERPDVPILCLTEGEATARRLVLVWGIHGVITQDVRNFSDMVDKACRIARNEKLAQKGERLVVTAGVPFGTPGATNILRIAWVGDQIQFRLCGIVPVEYQTLSRDRRRENPRQIRPSPKTASVPGSATGENSAGGGNSPKLPSASIPCPLVSNRTSPFIPAVFRSETLLP